MSYTEFRDFEGELSRFQLRLGVAGVFVVAAFAVLLGRFAYLQLVQHDYYKTNAEDNRISVVPVVPNRGLIMDRNGIVLARNESQYTLEINPQRVANLEQTISELATVVEILPRDRNRFRKLRQEIKGADSLPIKTRLTDEEVARFAANAYRFPGVDIKARLFRSYPFGETASHALGYIGRISDRDVERLEADGLTANYKGSDFIGKSGIESSYERELHGTTGSAQVEIDAGGRGIRTLSSTPPVAGNNLVLTLDINLQEIAEAAFGNFRGALVAIDPTTGGILAFVSKPGYDPNLFVDGIDPQSWQALNEDQDKPLNNRALTGAYPPGSTIKPFMALMALELGKRTPEYTISDPGFFTLPGVARPFRDWKVGGHGAVNLHRSVVVSCDTYYYGLAADTDIDQQHAFLSQLDSGIQAVSTSTARRAGCSPRASGSSLQATDEQKWYVRDNVSVRMGGLLPRHAAAARSLAIVANNGVAYPPHRQPRRRCEIGRRAKSAYRCTRSSSTRNGSIWWARWSRTPPAARRRAPRRRHVRRQTGTAQVMR
jgi:penicillin-binding protein 2